MSLGWRVRIAVYPWPDSLSLLAYGNVYLDSSQRHKILLGHGTLEILLLAIAFIVILFVFINIYLMFATKDLLQFKYPIRLLLIW